MIRSRRFLRVLFLANELNCAAGTFGWLFTVWVKCHVIHLNISVIVISDITGCQWKETYWEIMIIERDLFTAYKLTNVLEIFRFFSFIVFIFKSPKPQECLDSFFFFLMTKRAVWFVVLLVLLKFKSHWFY